MDLSLGLNKLYVLVIMFMSMNVYNMDICVYIFVVALSDAKH